MILCGIDRTALSRPARRGRGCDLWEFVHPRLIDGLPAADAETNRDVAFLVPFIAACPPRRRFGTGVVRLRNRSRLIEFVPGVGGRRFLRFAVETGKDRLKGHFPAAIAF
jgi:hypothetical protein